MLESQKKTMRKYLIKHEGEDSSFSNKSLAFNALEILEYDLRRYDDANDYGYLLKLASYLYESENFERETQDEIVTKLGELRHLIKLNLANKNSMKKENYEYLKKLIGKIEVLSLTIANTQKESVENDKLELLHYLVFSIKNTSVLKNILKKDRNQINIADEKGLNFILEVIENYLEVLKIHVQNDKFEKLDDLIYYDRVLSILFNHNIANFNVENISIFNEVFKKAIFQMPNFLYSEERYLYFVYKWRDCFEKFLNYPGEKINIPTLYDKKELMYQYQVNPEFSYATELQAKTILYSNKFEKVLDIPKIYTVDGEGAEELDDGFSCSKNGNLYRLGIHITNPLLYLNEDSFVFKEATRRATSIYTNDFIPMFPIRLATDLFSLNQGQIRKVTSLYTTIDLANQKIVKFEPVFESVYVTLNDTYHSCSYTLNMEVGEEEYVETLKNIKDLLPFLKQFYLVDEVYRKLNRSEFQEIHPTSTKRSSSTSMIETLMIFTNHMYAKYTIENNIPCFFRNHEMTPFYKQDLENFKNILSQKLAGSTYLNEISILVSNYPRSFYGLTNLGHFGLGTSCYTHFTSPDRRVPDCYNALILKKYLEGVSISSSEIELYQQVANSINQKNNSIRLYMKEYEQSLKRVK